MTTVVEDLVVKLTGDITGLSSSMTGAGSSLDGVSTKSSNLQKALGLIGPAVGAGIGLAFGAALQMGQQLDAATQKLAADTGLSGDALKQQSQAIDSLYQSNLQSMDTIEASLAQVISGFDLSGQAADDLTQKMLNYETATGQGSDAVKAIKMDIDAWNLTAADSTTIMDQLVASHQKYDTTVGDMQTALQKIAPAMQAMGMSEKDGVDLLNLFASAGIDSTKAATGLQTAVKNLQPGQNLNDLIVQISSIKDPLERAQAAGKVFGTRLGSQMADALQPGITSLDQFATSSSDTVGASDKAAAAIEDDWGNRATLALHQVGGALASVGAQFGPLLSAAAIAGPGITKAITTGLGGLAGMLIPKLLEQLGLTVPAAVAGGTAQGAAAGAAAVTAEAAAVAGGGSVMEAAFAAEAPEAAAAGTLLGSAVGAAALVAIPAALIAGGLGLGAILGNLSVMIAGKAPLQTAGGVNPISGQQYGVNPILPVAPTDTSAASAQAARAQQAQTDAMVAAQLTADQPLITGAAETTFSGETFAMQEAGVASVQALNKGIDDQVTAIHTARTALASAWTDALSDSTAAQTIGYREQAALADISDTQKALADKATYAKLSTQQKDALHEQLLTQQAAYVTLLEESTNYGTDNQKAIALATLLQSKALKDGLASTDPDTVAVWQKVQTDTEAALATLEATMRAGGASASAAFIASLANPAAIVGVSSVAGGGGLDRLNSSSSGTVPHYQHGTSFVPYDQLAYLDQGEAVTTAAQNRSGGAGVTVNIYNPTPEPASNSIQHELLMLAHVGYLGG